MSEGLYLKGPPFDSQSRRLSAVEYRKYLNPDWHTDICVGTGKKGKHCFLLRFRDFSKVKKKINK